MNNILDEHSEVWKEHSQVFSHLFKRRLQEKKVTTLISSVRKLVAREVKLVKNEPGIGANSLLPSRTKYQLIE